MPRIAGSVRRAGNSLLVQSDKYATDSDWRSRAIASLMQVGGSGTWRSRGDGTLEVPLVYAPRLTEILNPYDEGGDWHWSDDAREAAKQVAEIELEARRALGAQELSGDSSQLEDVLREAGMCRSLLPEQARAVSDLIHLGSGGNFSVPGAGKTAMTYAFFAYMRALARVDRMLVIAPLSAHESWVEEVGECFAEGLRPTVTVNPGSWPRSADVVVVNYERLAMRITRVNAHSWSEGRRLLVVFDEAHRAKRGLTGAYGAAAADVAQLGKLRLVLTGTPMPNGERDLASVLDLAWPGFGQRMLSGEFSGASDRKPWVRVTKDQLGISPLQLTVERVQLDEHHRNFYAAMTSEVAELESSGLFDDRPELASRGVMRLIAAAANPALLRSSAKSLDWPIDLAGPASPDIATLMAGVTRFVRPAKLLRAAEIARESAHAGEKCLIWSTFLGNVEELTRLLAPLGPAVITGSTPVADPKAQTDRRRELARFRYDDECKVLIATPQSLGEGISLHQVCQLQVHVDRNFNAGLFLQALDRTHRIGMPERARAKAVVLAARETIDERIDLALREKLMVMEAALCDPALRRLAMPDIDEGPALSMDPVESRDLLKSMLAHLQASP